MHKQNSLNIFVTLGAGFFILFAAGFVSAVEAPSSDATSAASSLDSSVSSPGVTAIQGDPDFDLLKNTGSLPPGDPDFDLLREMPAVSTKEACYAKCRDQYGGSGSAGYDACIRSCGADGAARGAACSGDVAPGCEVPMTPVCKDGKWICVPPATGSSGARIESDSSVMSITNEGRDRLRVGISVNAVEVRGWDPKMKEEFLLTVKEHAELKSGQDLENFARGVLVKDENVENVAIGEEGVQISYRQPAKFLGIFSSSLVMRAEADKEGRVKVRFPWYGFLFRKHVSAIDVQVDAEKEVTSIKQTMQTQVKEGASDQELEAIRLQETMNRQSRILQTLSNIMKASHDTAMSVIRNMK